MSSKSIAAGKAKVYPARSAPAPPTPSGGDHIIVEDLDGLPADAARDATANPDSGGNVSGSAIISTDNDDETENSNPGANTSDEDGSESGETKSEHGELASQARRRLESIDFINEMAEAKHRRNVRPSRRSTLARSENSGDTMSEEEMWRFAIQGRWEAQRKSFVRTGTLGKQTSTNKNIMQPFRGKGKKSRRRLSTIAQRSLQRQKSHRMNVVRRSMSSSGSMVRNRNTKQKKRRKTSALALVRKRNGKAKGDEGMDVNDDDEVGDDYSMSATRARQASTGAIAVDAEVLRAAAQQDRLHRFRRCWEDLLQWRIYPDTYVHLIWSLSTVFFVLWTGILLPVTVAVVHSDRRPVWWEIIDILADVFFIVDVFLNFRCVYTDTWGSQITNTHKIAQHYIFGDSGVGLGWFWIDFPAGKRLLCVYVFCYGIPGKSSWCSHHHPSPPLLPPLHM